LSARWWTKLEISDLKVHIRDKGQGLATLPQLFKLSGYHTQGIGKIFRNWHLSKYENERPSLEPQPHTVSGLSCCSSV
jgi:arylsulfatase A-like enzyme